MARRRVIGFSPIDNAWIFESLLERDKDADEALRTCQVRGWIEHIPHGGMAKDDPPLKPGVIKRVALYRLTDSGWNAINGTHAWLVWTFLVALVTLAATVVGILLSNYQSMKK